VKPASKTTVAQVASDLAQTAVSRALILSGTPAERSQLANAIASELDRRIRNVAADPNDLLAATAFIKSISTADQENWILFFDEADSLFGKRTTITDAHDRYANLETSFAGLIIFGVDKTDDLVPEIVQQSKTLRVGDHWPPR
jgi:SpoVK/Ycf46/Vps4 family AAA+-type ATPase